MSINVVNEKKKVLLTRIEKIKAEIHYFEKRIEDFHANRSKDSLFHDECR